MNIAICDPIAAVLGSWASELNAGSIVFRIAISIILAAIIGCERSSKRHSAGLRTFILVSLATTAAMIIDVYISYVGKSLYLISAAAVLSIAIISANTMLFSSKSQIKGLTTSVALWACGVIGLATGAGLYTLTLVAFVALMSSLFFFPAFEAYLKNRSNHFEVHLELKSSNFLQNFVTTIRKLGLTIDDIELNHAYSGSGLSVYSVAISVSSKELKKYKTHTEIIEALSTLDYIYYIEEMHS